MNITPQATPLYAVSTKCELGLVIGWWPTGDGGPEELYLPVIVGLGNPYPQGGHFSEGRGRVQGFDAVEGLYLSLTDAHEAVVELINRANRAER